MGRDAPSDHPGSSTGSPNETAGGEVSPLLADQAPDGVADHEVIRDLDALLNEAILNLAKGKGFPVRLTENADDRLFEGCQNH
jgi:hypothetical protein